MTPDEMDVDRAASVGERTCPAWCRTRHGASDGEEDWLHVSEPLIMADGIVACLCMSVGPQTDEADGPYVIVGSREYSLAEAAELGASLIQLAAVGATPRSAA